MSETKTTAKSVMVAEVSGKKVYATATGLKVGPRGKVQTPQEVVSGLSKGDKRRLRRGLHRVGRGGMAVATLAAA